MKPCLFNTEMVRAILDDRKTVTRRVVKPQPVMGGFFETCFDWRGVKAPYRPGDILYVRETFCRQPSEAYPFVYKSSVEAPDAWKWRPSIHMPREAARIFLRVTDVRVERLQKITPEQLRAEGFPIFVTPSECKNSFNRFGAVCDYKNKLEKFSDLWDSTIKKEDLNLYGWDANPWVWVIEFERCEKP